MWFQCMMYVNKDNFCFVVDFIIDVGDDDIYKIICIVVEFVGYCIFCELSLCFDMSYVVSVFMLLVE